MKLFKTWIKSQRIHYGKSTQSISGMAHKEMTERQNWVQDKFTFLKSKEGRKSFSNSSRFKSPQKGASASAASAHGNSRGSTDTDSLEASIYSDTTHQPSICSTTSTSVVSQISLIDQQTMDKFAQMKTMLTLFLGPRQETITKTFCNYLASEVKKLEESDFQTFINETIKL